MACFIAWLDHWQELIGAIIGALGGLLAALVVAHSSERRQERASGMVLIDKLLSLKAAFERIIGKGAPDSHIATELHSRFPIDDSSIETLVYELSQLISIWL